MLATRDDVTRVANEYLAPDRAGVVVYRPSTSDSFAPSGEEMRALLDREPRPAPLAAPPAYSARILPGATTPEELTAAAHAVALAEPAASSSTARRRARRSSCARNPARL